jgi:hypothetical protein
VSHDPLGPVVITPRDIYDQLVRLTDIVGKLAERETATTRDLEDHERRLRAVEARLWPLPTVSILIAVAALAIGLLRGAS